jgi:ligand-binding sensor domain-containing protein
MISNAIQTLWTDDTGVWVGAARGLYRFDGENWFDYAQDVPNLRDVRAIAPGQSPDQLWIGSWRMGLQRLQQGVYIPDEILTQPIVALAAGVNGTTWAATIDTVYWQSQFNRGWEPIPHPIQNLIGGSVIQTMCHQLAPAPGGGIESTLWVGTSAGLFYYVPDREQWNEIKELSSLSVQALAVDPFTKRLWAGTSDGLFSEPAWECCHDGNVLALAFNHASDGNLWLGTNEGLEVWSSCGETGQFDGQPVNCFTAVDSGLAADRVTAISIRLVDDELEIWIGSPNGVSCYQPRPAEEKQR